MVISSDERTTARPLLGSFLSAGALRPPHQSFAEPALRCSDLSPGRG